ncbi:MAG TPA: hypothetical protein VJU78_03905 [Chitinophagaceae bacterium]|nr:hypothetical protein [Chitinophagaceae bacterium]
MRKSHLLVLMFYIVFQAKGQLPTWTFKKPVITIHFGTGNIRDVNTIMPYNYERVGGSCPTDGHYTYTPYTSDCFRGDWFTLTEDHTSGDANGNMMLVNSSYSKGPFFRTDLNGLKGGTTYEFSVWMMNVCKITDKCPYPLLPNIAMRLQTPSGKSIAQFATGEVARRHAPGWTQYRAPFTTPSTETSLTLIMVNNAPGGCGNDFALDDITIREIIPTPVSSVTPKKKAVVKKQPVTVKQAPKKALPPTVKTKTPTGTREKAQTILVIKQARPIFPPPPPFLATRTNSLIKQLETEAGEIRLDLYDNGEIDGDTVSIYHNNVLLVSHARLSQNPITFRVDVNAANPYHELVMVAENLGSIPPNTSVMIITAGSKRYKVFISSTEQKNAKLVLNLKE